MRRDIDLGVKCKEDHPGFKKLGRLTRRKWRLEASQHLENTNKGARVLRVFQVKMGKEESKKKKGRGGSVRQEEGV